MNTVPCPICQKAVEWSPESLFRPFCSERCRIRDLGAWANNAYAIPVKFSHEAEDSGENVMQIQENDPNSK